MDESQTARYGEGQRRKTVFRKIRQLCTFIQFEILSDNHGQFKSTLDIQDA